ncbi:MAG TPA: hypothetical protein VKR24_09540, partial [Candidatus Limnocylindrales bacterium]|nr:hypothetical protein [Candidatus Limnocylindrales bacterium]
MVLASSSRRAAPGLQPAVRLERIPALDRVAPIDAAELLRGWPGLVLLESARPGRRSRWSFLSADPLEVLLRPSPGPDPFAEGRRMLARLSPAAAADPDGPPFIGGLAGFLGYDLGLRLEPRAQLVPNDQGLPDLRLALHDWVLAWDRRNGQAWLGGRAVDGGAERLAQRLAAVRRRVETGPDNQDPPPLGRSEPELVFTSSLDRGAYESGVAAIRRAIRD